MDFIIITVAIMTISSLMLHKMLRMCGLNINLQPLMLCGILALLVNFSAITISPYLSTTHFIMLGILILVSSAAATWYNHWLDIKVNIPVAIAAEAADPIVPEIAEATAPPIEPPIPEGVLYEIDAADTAPEPPVSELVPTVKNTVEIVQEESTSKETIVEATPSEIPSEEDTAETVLSENVETATIESTTNKTTPVDDANKIEPTTVNPPVYELIEKPVPLEAMTSNNTDVVEPDVTEDLTDVVIGGTDTNEAPDDITDVPDTVVPPTDNVDVEPDTVEAPADAIVDETDVDEAPDDVIVDEADVDEAPDDVIVDEADVDEAPDDAIVDEADVDEAPDDVIVGEADVDEAPDDVIVDEADVDEAPVKEEYVPVIENSVVAAVAAMETLDDILDYAFEQKTLSNFQNSLYASSEALRQYCDDSYAPFIAIDMINICKAIGDYGRAVEIYHDAINLPAVVENPDIKHELQAGLVYITCIIKILANHEISNTPYSNIPSDVMKEIEKIYIIHKNNI